MNTTARTILALAGALAIGACKERSQTPAPAQSTEPVPTNASDTTSSQQGAPRPPTAAADKPADNTARNDRDASGDSTTPIDQGQSAADVKVSAAIRSAILADNTMSLNAQNVKIITKDGVVTLRGPIESLSEKGKIEALARSTPGVVRVDNQLEVRFP